MKLMIGLCLLVFCSSALAQSWRNSEDAGGLKYGTCLDSIENAYKAAGFSNAFIVAGDTLVVHTNNGAVAYSDKGSTTIGTLSCQHNRNDKINKGLSYLLKKLDDNRNSNQLGAIKKEIKNLDACLWVTDDSAGIYQRLRAKAGLTALTIQRRDKSSSTIR
jgi:hypothetical protein